jgi:lipoate-protein ligase A
LAGISISTGDLAAAIRRAFAKETGFIPVEGDWTAAERERTREIAETKYRSDAWNWKR